MVRLSFPSTLALRVPGPTIPLTIPAAIQIAKLVGHSPIITTASLHNEPLLKSLGATAVLDRKLPASTIISEVQKLAGGKPVEYVFDAISLADTQLLAYDALAPGGTLIIVLDEEIPMAKKQQARHSKRVVHGWGTVHVPENREIGMELFSRLTEWLRTGVIVVRVSVSGRVFRVADGTWHSRTRLRCFRMALRVSRMGSSGSSRTRSVGGSSLLVLRRPFEVNARHRCTCTAAFRSKPCAHSVDSDTEKRIANH